MRLCFLAELGGGACVLGCLPPGCGQRGPLYGAETGLLKRCEHKAPAGTSEGFLGSRFLLVSLSNPPEPQVPSHMSVSPSFPTSFWKENGLVLSKLLARVWPLLMFWDLHELFHLFCDDILWGLFFVWGGGGEGV